MLHRNLKSTRADGLSWIMLSEERELVRRLAGVRNGFGRAPVRLLRSGMHPPAFGGGEVVVSARWMQVHEPGAWAMIVAARLLGAADRMV